MPKETVQYPRTDVGANATEISVHWSRDSHVQLQVERHQFHVKSCGCNCNPCVHSGVWDGATDNLGHLPSVADDPAPIPETPEQAAALVDSTYRTAATAIKSVGFRLDKEVPRTMQDIRDKVDEVIAKLGELDLVPKPAEQTPDDITTDAWGIPCNHGVQVFTDVLDRGQINNLIRVLRRARDQAYGRDE